jgi:hypothetical protein
MAIFTPSRSGAAKKGEALIGLRPHFIFFTTREKVNLTKNAPLGLAKSQRKQFVGFPALWKWHLPCRAG